MIIQANHEHAQEILNIFRASTKTMLKAGIGQWHYDYPVLSHIQSDIQEGRCFLWMENTILGAITINQDQDDQYNNVEWQFASDAVWVIHRLAVHPDAQGKRIATSLCRFAEKFASKNGGDVIRLDAYAGNPSSNALYHKLGYSLANGYCYFHGNELPFNCYEISIKNKN